MKISSLFIGRFQPFHTGHITDIKKIISKGEHCIIAIAAANKSGTFLNPLTGDEREHILTKTLKEIEKENPEIKGNYEIHQIDDIDNDETWVTHVIKNMPEFSKIYSGSKWVRDLFEKDGSKEVYDIEMVKDKKGNIIHATTIRAFLDEDKNLEELMHEKTVELLEEIDFKKRMNQVDKD